jgi:hypothetical protein
MVHKFATSLDLRLTAVQLIDALYCTDAEKFLSAALLGTTTMMRLELPCVNVLSKVDLLQQYGELPMQLDFFTDCHDLDRLLPYLQSTAGLQQAGDGYTAEDNFDFADDPEYQKARRKRLQSKLNRKHQKLHEAIAEVVDDFGLLSFLPLDISSAESVGRVLAKIDKCNGYVFTETTSSVNEDLFQCAISAESVDSQFEALADVRERLASPDSIQELKR